jgi:hypothetical protein
MVAGVPLLQTFNVTVLKSPPVELTTIPSGLSLMVIFEPASGFVHSIRLIRELKNPRASLELPFSSFSCGSNIGFYAGCPQGPAGFSVNIPVENPPLVPLIETAYSLNEITATLNCPRRVVWTFCIT